MSFSLRVVIADDDHAMLESIRQMLHELGHQVVAAADTGEALLLACERAQPDVVITGCLSSTLSGCEAAARIYQKQPIPIILYSGTCEPTSVAQAEQRHVFMYLVKPINPEHLQAALKECRADQPHHGEDEDESLVPVGTASGTYSSFARMPYREHDQPPYPRLPR